MQFDTDIFIVGGGPAGLACAIAACGLGFRVVVADASRPPVDKACGDGLMPEAMHALCQLGVTLPAVCSNPISGVRFLGDGVSVEASFGSGSGRGIRRSALHEAMAARAGRAGADLLWGQTVTGLRGNTVRLGARSVTAQWIVGADGLHSRVRAWAGLDRASSESRRFGFRRYYEAAPWTSRVEVYWRDGFQIYVTPVAPGEVCVAVVSRDPGLRLETALAQVPELRSRLGSAAALSAERGAVTVSRRLRCVRAGSVALLGDASGSVDSVTGLGIGLGLQQALALANGLAHGDLALYQSAHRSLARRPRAMSAALLAMDRSPLIRLGALKTLASNPSWFRALLAFHAGRRGVVSYDHRPAPTRSA